MGTRLLIVAYLHGISFAAASSPIGKNGSVAAMKDPWNQRIYFTVKYFAHAFILLAEERIQLIALASTKTAKKGEKKS